MDQQTFQAEVIAGITELRTQMRVLMGNGQPGVIQTLDARVSTLETASSEERGAKKVRADLWAFVLSILTLIAGALHIFKH